MLKAEQSEWQAHTGTFQNSRQQNKLDMSMSNAYSIVNRCFASWLKIFARYSGSYRRAPTTFIYASPAFEELWLEQCDQLYKNKEVFFNPNS
jgi:hypothetical protein